MQAMRTAILINCGAAEDVRQLLELDRRPNVRIVIIDSHRPICHTANLEDPTDAVTVLLDESEGRAKLDIPPYLGPREPPHCAAAATLHSSRRVD
jgi:hypothetical protein